MKRIIAIQIQDNYLSDSEGNSVTVSSAETLLDFLLINYGEGCFKITWNIYKLINLLGKYLPEAAFQELLDKDRFQFGDYKLFSSQGRVFGVTYNKHLRDNFYQKHEENIYHLAQFFPGEKVETLDQIKVKGEELLKALDELGYNPSRLSSAVNIYDECVLSNNYFPTMLDLDEDGLNLCEYAEKAMGREWRACYKIGHWQPNSERQAWDYDVTSGYPSLMKDLLDTNEATIWYSKKYDSRADFGVCKGKVTITSDISPILNAEGIPVKGTWNDYLTTEQWACINKFKLGHFEMEDGWFIKFHSSIKPFFKIMNDLFTLREKEGVISTFAKAVAVGIGGRLAQLYPEKTGEYYNPIYALQTVSRMPLKVYKFIEDNHLHQDLISVTVDGLLTSKYVNLDNKRIMGNWRVSESVKALVMSMGYQFVDDKKPQNITYDQMMAEIQAHPNKQAYLGVLLNSNMLNNNRRFKSFPRTGQDLLSNIYESQAIEV